MPGRCSKPLHRRQGLCADLRDAGKFHVPALRDDLRDSPIVSATYGPGPPTTYALTMVNGTGGGTYAAGATVTVTANAPPAGQVFSTWTVNPTTVVMTSKTSATTALTMAPGTWMWI